MSEDSSSKTQHRSSAAVPEPLPGDGRRHANLRWLDGQPPSELLALAVYPVTPSVTWA